LAATAACASAITDPMSRAFNVELERDETGCWPSWLIVARPCAIAIFATLAQRDPGLPPRGTMSAPIRPASERSLCRQPDAHRHEPIVLPHVGRDLAGERGLDQVLRVVDRDGRHAAERRTIERNLQLRGPWNPGRDPGRRWPATFLERGLGLLERRPHLLEVAAEDLEHGPCRATPDTASSTLSLIGWLKLYSTPGISVSDARMSSTSWSLVRPLRHSSAGLSRTKVSLMFMPSSSVPSSGWPCSDKRGLDLGEREQPLGGCRATQSAASGLRDARRHLERRSPGSPSSSSGRNSMPRLFAGKPAGDHQAECERVRDPAPREQRAERPCGTARATSRSTSDRAQPRPWGRALPRTARAPGSARGRARRSARTCRSVRAGRKIRPSTRWRREHRDQRGDDDRHRVETSGATTSNRGAADDPEHLAARTTASFSRAMVDHVLDQDHPPPSTRMPKSIAPIEIKFAGQVDQAQPDERHEQREGYHRGDDQGTRGSCGGTASTRRG